MKFLAKKVVFLVSGGKNEISPFLSSSSKMLGFPEKIHSCHPGKNHSDTHVHNVFNHGQLVNHTALSRSPKV